MDAKYKILFERCGEYQSGDEVEGKYLAQSLADLAYLLKIGAIAPVEPAEVPKPKGARG